MSTAQARRRTARAITYVVLVAGLILWLFPFVWMLLGSFKKQAELLRFPPTIWPEDPTGANYATWFFQLGIGRYFANSVLIAGVTVLGNLVFCAMVGYALAKLQFWGKRALFVVVMVMLMVPGIVMFIPLFVLVSRMGLIGTYPGLILPFLTSPMGVFLMRQFMYAIPDELLEAARIDGAGELRIFARVVLPLCGPALATLGVLTFLGSWNNFLWPLVASQNQRMFTLPVALSLNAIGQRGTDHGLFLAGSVLIIVPILLVFVALQRFVIQGIATTGLRG